MLAYANFQEATIRPIVLRHLYCSPLNFLLCSLEFQNHSELFSTFLDESHESQNVKFEKENKQKPL